MILPLETIENLSEQLFQFNCHKVSTDNGKQIFCEVE